MYSYILSIGQTSVNTSMNEKEQPTTKPLKRKVILLTDFQFHSRMRLTPSIGKKIQQGLEQKSARRFYAPLPKPQPEPDNHFRFEIDLGSDYIKMVEEEKAKGYEVVLALPKGGAPIFAGEDTIAFISSKNGKRILRKLDKKINKDKM